MGAETPNEAYTPQQASTWVETNRGRVIRRAEKFQPYSAYDMEDFIQEAYTAALTAVKTCQDKPSLKFEAAFWTIFTANLSSMSTMPSQRDMIGGSASLAPCIHEEYREEYSDNEEPPTPAYSNFLDPLTALIKDEALPEERLKEEECSTMVMRALMVMTEKQRQVWQCLLERRRPTTEQIAQRLRKTRQGVEQLRDYGLQRVKDAFGITTLDDETDSTVEFNAPEEKQGDECENEQNMLDLLDDIDDIAIMETSEMEKKLKTNRDDNEMD